MCGLQHSFRNDSKFNNVNHFIYSFGPNFGPTLDPKLIFLISIMFQGFPCHVFEYTYDHMYALHPYRVYLESLVFYKTLLKPAPVTLSG